MQAVCVTRGLRRSGYCKECSCGQVHPAQCNEKVLSLDTEELTAASADLGCPKPMGSHRVTAYCLLCLLQV